MAWNKLPRQLQQIIAAQQQEAAKPITKLTRPYSRPVQQYTVRAQTPIPNGYGVTTVSAEGTATVSVGPAGLGTVWYPQSAAIATTTGAADSSTCQLYLGPLNQVQLVIGTSYAGGGDSIGLGVPPMTPGYYIVAVWSGAHEGDLATLAVYGTQSALTPAAS
jgi:hypothetical protein